MTDFELPSPGAWLTGYLKDALPAAGLDVPVRGEVPSPRPDSFVLVAEVGGVDETLVTSNPYLMVESWATSVSAARRLARLCDALMRQGVGTSIGGVRCRGYEPLALPYDSPDPDSHSPRSRQTIALRLHRL